jgi:hypothetical protein
MPQRVQIPVDPVWGAQVMRRAVSARLSFLVIAGFLGLITTVVVTEGRRNHPELDGSTLCYPFFGPVVQIDPALRDSLRSLARAHEAVHVEQCLRWGALANFVVRVGGRGRLQLEAQAYCAQTELELSWGIRADRLFDRIVDELDETVSGRSYGHNTPEEIQAVLTEECPRLAALATASRASRPAGSAKEEPQQRRAAHRDQPQVQ